MQSFLRQTTATRPLTFALGKFAGDAEFLRVEGGDGPASLDGWIDRSMEVAHVRCGPAWRSTFPTAPPYGFLWRPGNARSGELLCGVIAPSKDAVGRDYPLVVGTRFSQSLVERVPHIVPLVFGDFLEDAYGIIEAARTTPMPLGDLAERLLGAAAPSAEDVSRVASEYATWCQETPCDQAWGPIFPGQDAVVAAERAVEETAAAVQSFVGREDPSDSVVVRLPLGGGGPAAAALWLDIGRRLCRWSRTTPSAFWATDDASVLLSFGPPPTSVLGALWCAATPNDEIVDVTRREEAPMGAPSGERNVGDGVGYRSMHDWLESLVG